MLAQYRLFERWQSTLKRQSDGVHWHLVRCIGGQIIAAAFVSYRFRKAELATHTVCHILRIIPCIICLMLIFQCRSMTPALIEHTVVVPLDESHEFCGRIMGVFFVASYTVSANALHWTVAADKMTAVEGRCCICILSAQVWSQIAYSHSWSGGHWVGISLFSTWTVLSIIYRIGLYFILKKKSS
ncbi:unnamed protein product [Strongylus vulgaris]|uniref:Uncharacterized protein n=1 Tax=Strongylus vulgaris TaxID=40348 RepID=A0A3P7LLI2_STRVU|nr:unnamed protein product [Strongylus vulgaris]